MKQFLLAAGLLLVSAHPAMAAMTPKQTGSPVRMEIREEVRQEVREQNQEMAENRCNVVTNRIETRVSRYDNNRQMQTAGYKRVREWLASLITKLEADGKDTTNLKSVLSTFDTKLKKFDTDYAAYIDALKATKGYACGKSEGEFATKLEAARGYLKTLRADITDIRNYYQTQVRPTVQALKAN